MTLSTNHNNKLACHAFIHISQAPAQPIPESKLPKACHITTADGSHPGGDWQLIEFLRLSLKELRSFITYPSHGVDYIEFMTMYMLQNPGTTPDTLMAVYYYKKGEE